MLACVSPQRLETALIARRLESSRTCPVSISQFTGHNNAISSHIK
jgi:hypothetical protein